MFPYPVGPGDGFDDFTAEFVENMSVIEFIGKSIALQEVGSFVSEPLTPDAYDRMLIVRLSASLSSHIFSGKFDQTKRRGVTIANGH
jgi:hypothetical protein